MMGDLDDIDLADPRLDEHRLALGLEIAREQERAPGVADRDDE